MYNQVMSYFERLAQHYDAPIENVILVGTANTGSENWWAKCNHGSIPFWWPGNGHRLMPTDVDLPLTTLALHDQYTVTDGAGSETKLYVGQCPDCGRVLLVERPLAVSP
jgi:hypothetical protein